MKFIHYSRKPTICFRNHYQATNSLKPRGLWISVEGPDSFGWKKWCESAEFELENLRHEIEIVFRDDANILFLETEEDIVDFDKKFGEYTCGRRSCDWVAVARKYQGIVIAPYQWGLRFNLRWYYGWDCASGCVWAMTALQPPTSQFACAAARYKGRQTP